jgi:putative transposase
MRTNHPEHLKTFDYLGLHRYFLTFCTHERHRGFAESDRVTLVLAQILRAALEESVAVITYCFMPDHLHLFVEGLSDAADCRRFICRAKQFSGYHYQRAFGTRLWQRYGYERTLRDSDATISVIRYIVENPVRAGLVVRPDDYPFVGSVRYARSELFEAVQMGDAWRPEGPG